MRNKVIPYNSKLKELARKLRKQGILSEVLLWQAVKGKALGVEFHRQVPMLDYIVDFYCHELMLVIEIDGVTHNFDGADERDAHRQSRIEAYGVQFLRFNDSEIKKDMTGVIRIIENTISLIQERNLKNSSFEGGAL